MVVLEDEYLRRLRRQAPAGRRFVGSQLRRLSLLEAGLYGFERAGRSGSHVEHGDEAGLYQRRPEGRHDLGVDRKEYRGIPIASAEQGRGIWLPVAVAQVVLVEGQAQRLRRLG